MTADAANGIFTYPNAAGVLQKVNLYTLTGLTPDPTIAALIKQIPPPSAINTTSAGDSTSLTALRNTGGYAFNIRNNRIRNNVTGKGDYVLSPKNTFSVTFAYNTDLLDRPDVATNFATPAERDQRRQSEVVLRRVALRAQGEPDERSPLWLQPGAGAVSDQRELRHARSTAACCSPIP